MKHLVLVFAVLLAGCGVTAESAPLSDSGPLTLRLGYFPDFTQAPALLGIDKGFFASAMGNDVTIEMHPFHAGSEAVTAILSGSIDATFIGPNPTINAFAQSHGQAIRVIAGATSGGTMLVVKPSITSVAQLKGKKIADPQLGGTQDVALRWFLKDNGFTTDTAGGGDVNVLSQDNSQTLTDFMQGQIDGAWVPEPWACLLVVVGGGKVLVDERNLWPQGQFVTTNLIVRTGFLHAHPRRVKGLIEGLYQAVSYLNSNPSDAQQLTNDAVAGSTGTKLPAGIVAGAWVHMTFTLDPLPTTLKTSADHAQALGLLDAVDLKGLYDLTLLNQVLAGHKQPAVHGL